MKNQGKTEFFFIANQEFKDINPRTSGMEHCLPNHSFGPASRENYLMHYIVSGKGRFYADGTEYNLGAGDCFFIRPFEIITYIADESDPWYYIWVGFDCNVFRQTLDKTRIISSKRIGRTFLEITDLQHISHGREAFLCSKIWSILSVLTDEKGGTESSDTDYVEMAISYIETEYMRGISITELAQKLNLNRSYFSTIFKEKTGVSPQRYLLDFRLNKAAMLISDYNYNATQAALSTGYSDLFTFSKMFKRKFGISPSEYKKQVLN